MTGRILWLDLLRTLAIILMVTYHAAFDLQVFYAWNIDVFHGTWNILRLVTVCLFLGVAGFSTHLTKHPYTRALTIGIAATCVTVATLVWDPETYVRFGILHCIAVSVALLPFCARLQAWAILVGMAVIVAGNTFSGHITTTSLLIPFGFIPPLFATLDYYPLLPWFGITMIGYGFGFFAQLHRTQHSSRLTNALTLPGRHALGIYLLHQPILIGAMYVIS